jgi:hypothetical protein
MLLLEFDAYFLSAVSDVFSFGRRKIDAGRTVWFDYNKGQVAFFCHIFESPLPVGNA